MNPDRRKPVGVLVFVVCQIRSSRVRLEQPVQRFEHYELAGDGRRRETDRVPYSHRRDLRGDYASQKFDRSITRTPLKANLTMLGCLQSIGFRSASRSMQSKCPDDTGLFVVSLKLTVEFASAGKSTEILFIHEELTKAEIRKAIPKYGPHTDQTWPV